MLGGADPIVTRVNNGVLTFSPEAPLLLCFQLSVICTVAITQDNPLAVLFDLRLHHV